jgi:thermostable 8-oxoguanine DNA glycosylase
MSKVVVDLGNGYRLTENDLKFSNYRHGCEKRFVGAENPVDELSVYRSLLYSMLSAAQNTPKLIKVYENIKRHGMDRPGSANNISQKELKYLFGGLRFPNVKMKRYVLFDKWFGEEEPKRFVSHMAKSINEGRLEEQKCLRHYLSKKGPAGVKHKVASLAIQTLAKEPRQVGIVCNDKWIYEIMNKTGHTVNGEEIRIPDGRTVPGIPVRIYLGCEKIITEYAKKAGLSPGEMAYGLWCKYAYVEPNKELSDFF